jgi:hypothetical protein
LAKTKGLTCTLYLVINDSDHKITFSTKISRRDAGPQSSTYARTTQQYYPKTTTETTRTSRQREWSRQPMTASHPPAVPAVLRRRAHAEAEQWKPPERQRHAALALAPPNKRNVQAASIACYSAPRDLMCPGKKKMENGRGFVRTCTSAPSLAGTTKRTGNENEIEATPAPRIELTGAQRRRAGSGGGWGARASGASGSSDSTGIREARRRRFGGGVVNRSLNWK